MKDYFGDLRDTFDAIYETSASFVVLAEHFEGNREHFRFSTDLSTESGREVFKRLCYRYEDTYDWNRMPLVFDPEQEHETFQWRNGAIIERELPFQDALDEL